jgi:DNA-directed RNA polymerase subunit M/transcription elongation factor TFIIS
MGHDPDRRKTCLECGSEDPELLQRNKVPGGLDVYFYECRECGNRWTT